KFGDIAPFQPIPFALPGGATAGVRPGGTFEGRGVAPMTGDYQFRAYSNGRTRVWLNDRIMIDHYKKNWATEYDQFTAHLEAGTGFSIKVENTAGTTLQMEWKTPGP